MITTREITRCKISAIHPVDGRKCALRMESIEDRTSETSSKNATDQDQAEGERRGP